MYILVVEDDTTWRSTMREGLGAAGHQVAEAATIAEAHASLGRGRPDLMLVDRSLPDGDGLDLVQSLRDRGVPVPAIIVSGRADAPDRVMGLQGGADDYLAKPFFMPELLARVEAVSRRSSIAESLRFGALVIDILQHRATLHGEVLELSGREFDLLCVLARNPGRGLSRAFLWKKAWGLESDPFTNVVDVYIRHLRTKLGQDWIRTVRGVGYLFEPPPEGSPT